ncbi:MAG: hypothetical protein COT81_04980, partial [Candidatus Buchananbacteria bacterium CG10_big_fil_rev_8_21_14_0_10_42_9]
MYIRNGFWRKSLASASALALIFNLLAPIGAALAQNLSNDITNPGANQDFSLPSKELDLSIASSPSGAHFASNFVAGDNAGLTPRNSGNFGVDELTGTFSFTYPITFPPGRAGMQPNLALQYNHQLKNVGSMVGYGWQLTIPNISRDNRFGVDALYNRNDFTLSLGGSSQLEPISVDANGYGSYGKKIESDFAKIEFNSSNKWLVTDKLGTVYTFGSSAATRQDNPADSSKIYKWMLEEVRDTNDNFVRYEYYKDSGQIYPKKIFYTGHGSTDGIFEVDFEPFANGTPQENNVLTTSYQSGFEAQTKFLIDSIDVKIDGSLKTSYALEFSSDSAGRKYLLASITPEFYDGGPAQVKDKVDFDYSYEPTSYTLADFGYYELPNVLGESPGSDMQADLFLDLNGDSLTDYVRTECNVNGDVTVNAWTNDGDGGWTTSIAYSKFIDGSYNCTSLYGQSHTIPVAFANLNGDNLVDMVADNSYFINSGSGWQETAANILPVGLHDSTSNSQPPADQVIFRDMNADGYDDIIFNYHPSDSVASIDVYMRDTSSYSWILDQNYSVTSGNMGASDCLKYGGDPFGYVDLNDDGLPDIFYSYNCTFFNPPYSGSQAYLNTGEGFIATNDFVVPTTVSSFSGASPEQHVHYFSDFNGDGVHETAGYSRGKWQNSSSWNSMGLLSLFGEVFNTGIIGGSYFDTTLPVAIADVNGDQIQDVIHSYSSTFDLYLGRSVKPDVLEKITYQSGAQTYIYYDYSANEKDGSGNLENPDLPFSIHVVKEVINDNGDGQWLGTRYFYRDGKTTSYLSEGIKDVFGFGEVEKHIGKAIPDIDFGTGADGAFVSSGNATWTTDKNFTSLTVQSGHTITVEPQVVIKVQGDVVIDGTFSAKGQGYRGGRSRLCCSEAGSGPGGGGGGALINFPAATGGGGGGGYAEVGQGGGDAIASPAGGGGEIYGNDLLEAIDKGSGGGSGGSVYNIESGGGGGYGGGIIQLFAQNIDINGEINVDGNDGGDGHTATNIYTGGGGGGAGGSIFIKALNVADLGTSLVHADGGQGGAETGEYDNFGGNGAPGRIRIEAKEIIGSTSPAYFRVGDFDYSILNTPQDENLKKIVDSYHIAADSGLYLHGRLKQSKTLDDQDTLIATSFQSWQATDLGNGREFVSVTDSSNTDFSGTHVSTATEYTYDTSNGNILTEEQLGKVVVNTTTGEITDELTGDERTTTYQYASNATKHILALPKTQVVSDGILSRQKDFYYDGLLHGQVDIGNLTKEDFIVDDVEINRSYNAYGLMTGETDAKGNTTNISYDSYSLYPATTTNALSQSTLTSFNLLNGDLSISTDANGNSSQNSFDAFGRITEIIVTNIDNPTQLVTSQTITYEDSNLPRYREITTYLDGTISVVSREYKNGQDQLIQTKTEMEDGSFSTVDFAYDPFGRLTRQSLPYVTASIAYSVPDLAKPATTYTYDVLDRVLSETTSVGLTSYQYDGLSTTITDANGNDKDLVNDAYGNLVKVKEHNDTSIYTTSYEYNPFNELTKNIDALNNVRNFTYDGLGRRTAAEDLHVSGDTSFGQWSYGYDKNGNLIQSVDPNSQTINYTYDELNRVETEDYTGQSGTEVTYAYDSCVNGVGYLCSASSTASLIEYSYKTNGLVASESATIDTEDFITAYDYDRQGNMILITYPDNSQVQYSYNGAGQLETVGQKEDGASGFSPLVINFDYDAAGNTVLQENANGTLTQNTYDPQQLYRLTNRLTEINGQMGLASLAFSDTETSDEFTNPPPVKGEQEGVDSLSQDLDGESGEEGLNTSSTEEPVSLEPTADQSADGTEVVSEQTAGETTDAIILGSDNSEIATSSDEIITDDTSEPVLDDGVIEQDTSTITNTSTPELIDDPSTESPSNIALELDSSNEPVVEGQTTSTDEIILDLPPSQGEQEGVLVDSPPVKGEQEGVDSLSQDLDAEEEPAATEESPFASLETYGADTPAPTSTEEIIDAGERLAKNKSLVSIDGKIRDRLIGKTDKEKANIKAAEIAKLNLGPNFTFEVGEEGSVNLPPVKGEQEGVLVDSPPVKGEQEGVNNFPAKTGLRIEIQKLEKIDGGIQVLARAWKNGAPVGFGKDGTVEIERFRIFNPPILVPDGTFITAYDAKLGRDIRKSNFKEDVTEALKQSLAHTISVVAKDGHNIVKGKIGNTTSVIYAGSGDGRSGGGESSWDAIHDATTKTVDGTLQVATGLFDGNYQINRAYAPFDTSVIGVGREVTSATFSAFNAATGNGDNDGTDYITIVNPTPATNNALITDDYDQFGAVNNPTEGIDSVNRVDLSNITVEQYQDFPLNATGLSWIDITGWTNLGAREGHDAEDSPYAGGSDTFNYLRWYDSDETGTTKDPKLVVEHFAASGSAPSVPTGLQSEGATNPTDVSDPTPEFSAVFNDPDTGDEALYYHIQVATSTSAWANSFWDSGKTAMAQTAEGARSPEISYGGPPLGWDGSTYYWRIKFWDQKDNEGVWSSETASFTMHAISGDASQSLGYTYDAVGNITQIIDSSDNNGAKTIDYTYDDLNRLTSAGTTDAVFGGDYTRTFTYDAIGNITNKSDQGDYSYDGGEGVSYANPHAVTSIGGSGGGAIALDGVITTATSNGNITESITVGSNDNRLLIVSFATHQGGGDATSMTYNGDSLTLLKSQTGSYGETVSIWGLVAPDSGTHTLQVNAPSNDFNTIGVYSLYNAKQSLPTITAGTSGTVYTSNLSITTTADNSWIIDAIEAEQALTVGGSSQTEDWNTQGGQYYMNGAGSHVVKATAGEQTMSWSVANGWRSNHAAVVVEPVDAGGTTYTYDNNGNLTSDSTWTHAWDYKNRLISSTSGQGPELIDNESFESSIGNWSNASSDTCDWLRDSGGTPSSNTGPSNGYDGSYYAYVETSSGYCYTSGNTADLEYTLSEAMAGQVEFHYHLYGANIGTLAVDAYNGSAWTNIWSLAGDQGNSWSGLQTASFGSGTTKLRFRYIAAGGWQGDAAIDLVKVYEQSGGQITYAYSHTGQRVKLDNGTATTLYPNKYYNTDGTTETKHIFTPSGTLLATVKNQGSSGGSSGITIDSTAQTSHWGEPSTVNWNHTVGEGENGLAVACVSGLATPGAPTWGGQAMTLITSENPTKCYYLLNPDTSTTTQVSVPGSTIVVGGSMVFFGVDQTDPIGAFTTENGSASPNDMTLVTEADNSMRVDVHGANRDDATAPTVSLDSGTVQFNDVVSQNQFRIGLFGYATEQATAGSDT